MSQFRSSGRFDYRRFRAARANSSTRRSGCRPFLEPLEERALLAAALSLNPVAAINENDVATLTGSVSGLVANNKFALDVTWGDGSVGTINDIADATGAKSFSITHRYLDDQPSGTPADNYAIGVKLTEATINLSPDVIFVIDISGSTGTTFQGNRHRRPEW